MSQASPCVGAANLQAWESVRAGSAENEVKVRAVRAPGELGGSTLLLLLWDPPGAWNSSPKGEVKRACLPAISRLGCTHLEKEIYRESDLRSHGSRQGQDPTVHAGLQVAPCAFPTAQTRSWKPHNLFR